jgi:hypothetical protein
MESNHTRAQKNKSGDVLVQSTTTDAPLIPVEQISKLKEIAPSRVYLIFEQNQKDLREETDFLAKYDLIFRAIDKQYDLRGNDLHTLIRTCMEQNGKLSTNHRMKFAARVPEEIFNAIEAQYLTCLAIKDEAGDC